MIPNMNTDVYEEKSLKLHYIRWRGAEHELA